MNFIDSESELVKNKIITQQTALSDSNGTINFTASGTEQSQISKNGDFKVPCARLEDLFENKKISFIKMDIEGAEPEAILGSSKLLDTKNPPILAI